MHLLGWQHGFSTLGHSVKIMAPSYGRVKSNIIKDASYVSLPRRSTFSFIMLQLACVLLLPVWILKYRPQVIFVRTCFLLFAMALVCKTARIPMIVEAGTVVDAEVRMRGQGAVLASFLRMLDRLNYRFVDGLVTVTDGARKEFMRRGANEATTIVIHNAAYSNVMRPVEQAAARKQLGFPQDNYIVGFAGSFSPWQGLDFLVECAPSIIRNAGQPVRLVLLGNGQCHKQLHRTIEQLGLSHCFQIISPMPFERLPLFYSACDVSVIPVYDLRRLRYGLDPLKFWDALSVGLPVLVPENCGLDAFLKHVGLPGTFQPGDKESFTRAIIATLQQTRVYQSRRQQVHQIVAQEYSWTCVAQQLTDFCSQLSQSR